MLDAIIWLGMYQAGTLNFQITGALIGTWVAVALLVKYGTSGWSRGEKAQMIIAGIGVVVWQALGESSIGILTGCGLLFYGAWGVVKDAWVNPEQYVGADKFASKLSWALFWLSCLPQTVALGPVSGWSIESASQPITFLLIESVMVGLIFIYAPREVEKRVITGITAGVKGFY